MDSSDSSSRPIAASARSNITTDTVDINKKEASFVTKDVRAVDGKKANETLNTDIPPSPPQRTVSHITSFRTGLSEPPDYNVEKAISNLSRLIGKVPSQLLRLIVDGRLLECEQGAFQYDKREPGSIRTMSVGLLTAIRSAVKGRHEIKPELFSFMHKKAMAESYQQFSSSHKTCKSGELNSKCVYYPIIPSTTIYTNAGIEELYEQFELFCLKSEVPLPVPYPLAFYGKIGASTNIVSINLELARELLGGIDGSDEDVIKAEFKKSFECFIEKFDCDKETKETIKSHFRKTGSRCIRCFTIDGIDNKKVLLEFISTQLESSLQNVKIKNDVYVALAEFLPGYFLIHPFPDGNLRAALLLCNHILIHFGLPPLVMHDPNITALYDKKQLTEELIRGSENCIAAAYEPKMHGYDFSTQSVGIQKQYQQFIEPLYTYLISEEWRK